MSRHPLRRLLAILLAVAFFSASMVQVTPAGAMPADTTPADTMPAGMDMTMVAHDGNADCPPMPCKGMTTDCMIGLGCIFMIGVPVPDASLVVALAWAPATYRWPSAAPADGRVRAPDLRPPIRLI
jgi:hypothetical protein